MKVPLGDQIRLHCQVCKSERRTMSRVLPSLFLLLAALACAVPKASTLEERLKTLSMRFPRHGADAYEVYKQLHPPPPYPVCFPARANGEVLLADGDSLAIRFDPGSPWSGFRSDPSPLSVYRGGVYKGEFLAVEFWNGYAMGFLVTKVPGQVPRKGDRIAHIEY